MSVASLDLRIAVDLDEAPPDGAPAEEIVRWAIESHDPERVAVVTGLQAEGVAVADMALAVDPQVRIVTVDTGRLPPETHAYIDTLRAHFGSTRIRAPSRRSSGSTASIPSTALRTSASNAATTARWLHSSRCWPVSTAGWSACGRRSR